MSQMLRIVKCGRELERPLHRQVELEIDRQTCLLHGSTSFFSIHVSNSVITFESKRFGLITIHWRTKPSDPVACTAQIIASNPLHSNYL